SFKYNILWCAWSHFKKYDFSAISTYDKAYSTQENIPKHHIDDFTAALVHYNMDLAAVIRYTGNNHTAQYRQPAKILKEVETLLPADVFHDFKKVLTNGAPSLLQADLSRKNFQAYLRYGAHQSVSNNIPGVMTTLNKEERNGYIIPLPKWTASFIPNLHLSPAGLLVRSGKKDRLVFDASFRPFPWCTALNDFTDKKNEPPMIFGTTLNRHLRRIYNLRVTYKNEDILLWDDDVRAAFRNVKHHPDIASAIAFIVDRLLIIPTGMTFGATFSPPNWEPWARARAALAEHLGTDSSLPITHTALLSAVEYDDQPTSLARFSSAKADKFNPGVLDHEGTPVNTPHSTFVDDNLIAEIKQRMPQAMAASIEALYRILGAPAEEIRQSALSKDKFFESKCSYERKQLGILINTRTMTVALPPEKRARLLTMLSHWHKGRRSFTALQAAQLIGNVAHACTICPWGQFLLIPLMDSLKHLLRKNRARLAHTKDFNNLLNRSDDSWIDPAFTKSSQATDGKAAISQAVWRCPTKTYIDKATRVSIDNIIDVMKNQT
ncbi:MAG: hypothetical protein ACRDL7_03130, partial [Gaiellaceae bacterium]